MNEKSQWDKLINDFKMSPDPPTEFPKTQCLNRPIPYRKACVDYVKKTMRCVGYRDYLATELDKLDKIEQIIDDYDLEAWEILEMIKEVLKND